MNRMTKVSVIALIACLLFIVIIIGRSSKLIGGQEKNALIQRVKESPDIPINFTNFESVPLIIQRAVTKEISGTEYQQLTGVEAPATDRFAAFPNVTLLNATDQRVMRLMVTVGNRQTKKWYVVTFGKANIAPHQTFSMTAADWRPEKVPNGTGDTKTAKASSEVADFNSLRMWWPGGARAKDLVFRIAMIEFDNGKQWVADEAKGSLWDK